MSSLLQQLNIEMSSIVEKARRSLVRIGNGRGGAGAGTIWHANGLIIIKKFFQGYGVFNARHFLSHMHCVEALRTGLMHCLIGFKVTLLQPCIYKEYNN